MILRYLPVSFFVFETCLSASSKCVSVVKPLKIAMPPNMEYCIFSFVLYTFFSSRRFIASLILDCFWLMNFKSTRSENHAVTFVIADNKPESVCSRFKY